MKVEFSLRKLKDPHNVGSVPEGKVLYGSYHSSNFWDIKGYASTRWMAIFNINVDYKKYQEIHDLTLVDIADSCLLEMNKVPERKKFAKRLRKPPFGTLELYRVYPKEDEEGSYLQVMAITNTKRSKFLWRFGDECQPVQTRRRGKASGRKKANK